MVKLLHPSCTHQNQSKKCEICLEFEFYHSKIVLRSIRNSTAYVTEYRLFFGMTKYPLNLNKPAINCSPWTKKIHARKLQMSLYKYMEPS